MRQTTPSVPLAADLKSNRCDATDYAKAVMCYTMAIDILRRQANVPSFGAIQRESDQIISALRGTGKRTRRNMLFPVEEDFKEGT
jgi:hypothetical protein